MDFTCREPVTCPAFKFKWVAKGVALRVRVPAIAPGKQRTVKSKVPPGALTAITQHKRKGVLLDAQGPFGFPLYSIRVKN